MTIPVRKLPLKSRLLLLMTLIFGSVTDRGTAGGRLTWDELPSLPPAPGQRTQPGLAGPFAGVQGPVLMVGGGANFPDAPPWDGGRKTWWDDLFVMERGSDGQVAWVSGKALKLPRKIGYGFSFSTEDGVICVGGCDAEQCFAEVFLLSWDPRAREVVQTPLPPLPEPLAFMSGAQLGSVLYVVGGQTTMKDATGVRAFWSLDLAQRHRPGKFAWKVLPPWPGPGRILPVAVAQRVNERDQVFVFSGRSQPPGRASTLFDDAYAYDAGLGTWRELGRIRTGSDTPETRCINAGTAVTDRTGRILVFGGDGGVLFRELESHDLAIAALTAPPATVDPADLRNRAEGIAAHTEAKRRIYEQHPGFSRDVLAYDPERDRWEVVGTTPATPQVTTVAVRWGEEILIPSGEIRPGVRTPAIIRIRIAP